MQILTLSLLIVQALFSSGSDFTIAGKWKTLKTERFSIQYPPDWDLDQSGLMGTSFMLFSPLDSDLDEFRENVNLMIQDLTEYPMTLDSYTELSVEQITTLNYSIIENERVEKKSPAHHRLSYSGTEENESLIFVQDYWVIGTDAIILTYTGKQETYESFKETSNKILGSFKLKMK